MKQCELRDQETKEPCEHEASIWLVAHNPSNPSQTMRRNLCACCTLLLILEMTISGIKFETGLLDESKNEKGEMGSLHQNSHMN